MPVLVPGRPPWHVAWALVLDFSVAPTRYIYGKLCHRLSRWDPVLPSSCPRCPAECLARSSCSVNLSSVNKEGPSCPGVGWVRLVLCPVEAGFAG